MMNGYGMGGWFGMGLWWIIVVVIVVVLGAWMFKRAGDSPSAPRESARDILDKRYARGEIGRDEYEQKKRDLAG
ncbi:MAG: SHOCT domain-containing protein [Burkholderiaceae bacterium]